MLRVCALLLGLGLTLGCRDQSSANEAPPSQAAQSGERPGLRSAPPLPSVRTLALPDPIGSSPGLSVGAEGIQLVWMSDVGEPTLSIAALASLPNAADEWSDVQVVTASSRVVIDWADVPAVGETASGRTVVAWPEHHTDDPGAGRGLRLAAALDDGSFGPAWSPDDVRRGLESGFAGFVTTAAGLRLFYLDGRELGRGGQGTMQLRSVAIDDDGQQQGPSVVLDERTCECCKLGVGLLGELAFAAYRDRSDTEIRDTFVAGPGLAPTQVAADGWTLAGCPVNGPAVAVAGARAHVAWFTGAEDRSATLIASADSLDAFAAPQRFDLGLPGGRVDLLALPDGDVLISWLELDPANPGLAALLTRRLGVDGRLGSAYAVAELGAARDWGFARAALLGDEVVWVYTDPTAADGRPRLQARIAPLPAEKVSDARGSH
ncbi:MAG TPA: hypothetical protein VM869_06275 [Enhygromyxa sp.]|nr:hypothetical protein [Enhygromyxa sp.]